MEDFVDKKEKIANLLEEYLEKKENLEQIKKQINIYLNDEDFKEKELFTNIFYEINKDLENLTNKQIKQRISMIRTYL